ncbi:MAG TPA: DUF4349 domain-containing protein [Actinomycetota bacterium]|jgi:hypothetical protein|nr:DUF4349 domain-containing protein [Actinomycetota bacterium]
MNRFRRIGVIVAGLLVASWAVGCASGTNSGATTGVAGGTDSAQVKGSLRAQAVPNAAPGAIDAGFQSTSLPQIGPKIIKTADVDLALQRGKFHPGLEQVVQIAGRYQGYVLSTTVGSASNPTGTVVIRVPETRFEAALADLKGLGKVTRENVSGQDVSQEFIDFQARLRNAKAQEAVLLNLMNRAKSVSATITVEQHLEGVQLEIERLKGQLRYLDNQTAMSTITVGLTQIGAVAHHDNSIQKAWRRAGAVLLGMVSAVIVGAAFIVPLGLLVLIGLMVTRRWWRPRLSL